MMEYREEDKNGKEEKKMAFIFTKLSPFPPFSQSKSHLARF